MVPSKLIFLHGASSSGKTTLARELLAQTPKPMWHLSIDHLRDSGVWRMDQFGAGKATWQAHRDRYFAGFHAALGAIARAGNDILLEHILDTPEWVPDLRQTLAGLDVFFVRIETPLPELAARETARNDRPIGSAVKDAAHIHKGLSYDLTLDGTAPASSNVTKLMSAMASHSGPSTFFQENMSWRNSD